MRKFEQVTDADLDRDIAEALAVEPSSAFTARIRQRVRLERQSRVSPWSLMGIAATLVVAITSLVAWQIRPAGVPLVNARTIAIDVVIPECRSGSEHIAALSPAVSARAENVPVALSRATSSEPVVLVDQREARAIRSLIAGVVSGQVDLAPVLNASTSAFLDVVPIAQNDTGGLQ